MRPLLIISLLAYTACSSKDKIQKEFNAIEIDMVKSEVLEVAGPPYWSDRKDGQDRWIYYLKPEDKSTERVVYFEDNKVVAKGLKKKARLSAEEMESIKADRPPKVIYKRKVSDEQLRNIIKKEVQKEEKKKKNNFEKILAITLDSLVQLNEVQ